MKFMTMVKGNENAGTPPQALFDAIDKLIAEQAKSGILVDAGGLLPTTQAARVRISGGKIKVTDGPFTEAKEVIGGYAILKAASLEEAIQMGKDFMELHIKHWPGWEGESEIRQMAEGPEAGQG
jgi:hypothetical protein